MDAVEVCLAVAEAGCFACLLGFDDGRLVAAKTKAIIAALIAGVVAGGVVVAEEARLHGAMGCVTSVARIIEKRFMDVSQLADLSSYAGKAAAGRGDGHVMAGEACLADILAKVSSVSLLMSIMAGGAFGGSGKELVLEGHLRGFTEVFRMASGAVAKHFLFAKEVSHGALMRLVAFYAASCGGGVEHGSLMSLDLAVTFKAQ